MRTRSWREWAPLKWSPWRRPPGFCLDLLGCCNTSIKEAGKYNLSAGHTGIPIKTGLLLQREDGFWMEAHKLSDNRHYPHSEQLSEPGNKSTLGSPRSEALDKPKLGINPSSGTVVLLFHPSFSIFLS